MNEQRTEPEPTAPRTTTEPQPGAISDDAESPRIKPVAVQSRSERLVFHARRVRVYTSTVVLVAMLVVLVVLIAVNTRRVRLSWAVGETRARLVWIILASALIGWIAGLATSVLVRRRIHRGS